MVTAVRLAAMYEDDRMLRSIRDLAPRPEEPLSVGEVIAQTPIGTKVPVTLFPTVGINRPGTDRWPVLIQGLEEIAHWVRTQAVPRLITGTEPPEPGLPMRYEISVGHEDERQAMSAGSTTSAGERHKKALAAASARGDLAEMISMIDGSPSEPQIARWLAQLNHEEVLERMSPLRMAFDYDPEVERHNFEVLKGCRDAALRFGDSDGPHEK